MYPVVAKPVSKAHCKTIPFILKIKYDVTISAGWSTGQVSSGETILGDHTVIDFECGVAMRRVLISEKDAT